MTPIRLRARRILAVAATVLALTLVTAAGDPAAADPSTTEPAPTAIPAVYNEVQLPAYGAAAIGLADGSGLVAASDPDRAIAIASISKAITALVVLERRPLRGESFGPTVTMTAADVELYHRYLAQNGTVLDVREGWTFRERELLALALVPSANNYAGSLSRWAFGSDVEFARAADSWVRKHGLTHTRLVEPTGLSPENTSTASDLVKVGRLVLQDPVTREIVRRSSIDTAHLPPQKSTNELLGRAGIDGIKTGTLGNEVGLLFSARVFTAAGPARLVGVILGGPGPERTRLNQDVLEMLASTKRELGLP